MPIASPELHQNTDFRCSLSTLIKAPGGKASLFFKRLRRRSRYRIALTGTPMPHGPMDIYAVFRFLQITIFGPSFAAFRQKFAVMGGFQRKQITGFQNLDELERLMSRVTFRVGKDVLDLPPETHVTYHCDLAGEAQVLAVQIQAGGVGVDLTRARYDIFYSLSFSLGDYDQAQSRVHRPGQTRPVEHIHLIARNTVDVRIMRAPEKRTEIVDSILAEITG